MRKIGLALAVLCGLAAPLQAAQLWFAPPDELRRGPHRDVAYNDDFPHLFDADPQWSAETDVLQLSPLMANEGTEDEFRRIGAFAKERHIKLAAGVDAMLFDAGKPAAELCGLGVEGSQGPGVNGRIFSRLKRIGLDIKYVAMDEPLTFGHYYQGASACRYSVEEAARRAAAAVAEIKQVYPGVRVEDDEAPQPVPLAQWRADFDGWLKAYRAAAGGPLDSVTFDVDLFADWRPRVAAGVEIAHRQGVRAGIIIINMRPTASDAQAVAAFKRAAQAVDASKLHFDIVKIANWTKHPFNNLPETDPAALTNVLAWYNHAHRHP